MNEAVINGGVSKGLIGPHNKELLRLKCGVSSGVCVEGMFTCRQPITHTLSSRKPQRSVPRVLKTLHTSVRPSQRDRDNNTKASVPTWSDFSGRHTKCRVASG